MIRFDEMVQERRAIDRYLKDMAREGPFIPHIQHLLGLLLWRADGHDVCPCMR